MFTITLLILNEFGDVLLDKSYTTTKDKHRKRFRAICSKGQRMLLTGDNKDKTIWGKVAVRMYDKEGEEIMKFNCSCYPV